jgi:hypothetical protein
MNWFAANSQPFEAKAMLLLGLQGLHGFVLRHKGYQGTPGRENESKGFLGVRRAPTGFADKRQWAIM